MFFAASAAASLAFLASTTTDLLRAPSAILRAVLATKVKYACSLLSVSVLACSSLATAHVSKDSGEDTAILFMAFSVPVWTVLGATTVCTVGLPVPTCVVTDAATDALVTPKDREN